MKNIIKLLLSIVPIFAICSCVGDYGSKEPQKSPQSLAYAENVSVRFTDSGKLVAILYSTKFVERDNLTWGWNVRADFYSSTGDAPQGGITADSGFVNQGRTGKEVQVFGNVHMTSPRGVELFADSLRWNPLSRKIESESDVRIVRGHETVRGKGIRSDPGFENIRIINVSGTLENL